MKKYTLMDLVTAVKPEFDHGMGFMTGSYPKMYVTELKAVKTYKQLKAFQKRWLVVYRLLHGRFPRPMDHAERILASGRLPRRGLMRKLNKMRDKAYEPRGGRVEAIAMNVMMPYALVHTTIMAHHFGTPDNAVMIQAFDGQELF